MYEQIIEVDGPERAPVVRTATRKWRVIGHRELNRPCFAQREYPEAGLWADDFVDAYGDRCVVVAEKLPSDDDPWPGSAFQVE